MVGAAAALLVLSLWLPPASLGNRLFRWDVPLIRAGEGGSVAHPTGVRVSLASEDMEGNVRVRIRALNAAGAPGVLASESLAALAPAGALTNIRPGSDEAAALQALPAKAAIFSPVYQINAYGAAPRGGQVVAPVPYELTDLGRADLYVWDGAAWHWAPSQPTADGLALIADIEPLPLMVAVARANDAPAVSAITVDAAQARALTPDTAAALVTVAGLTLGDDGALAGDLPRRADLALPAEARALVQISNVQGGVAQPDVANSVLASAEARALLVEQALFWVEGGDYAGLELALAGVDPARRADLSALATELATALRAAGRFLAVRVEAPTAGDQAWDTGAYDWRHLGATADLVRLPALVDPAAYAPGGAMGRLLTWATGEVHRTRLQLVLTTFSHRAAQGQVEPISYDTALALLAQGIAVETPGELLMPGDTVRLGRPAAGAPTAQLDADSQVSWFAYTDPQGVEHTVWIENGPSAARKLQLVSRHALGGVSLEHALAPENDQAIAALVRAFGQELIPTTPVYTVRWRVTAEDGAVVGEAVAPLDNPGFAWVAPDQPGQYAIEAVISDDGGQTERGLVARAEVVVPSPTATPMPSPTPTVTPSPTPTRTPTPAPVAVAPTPPPAPVAPPPARAAGFGYGIQAHIYHGMDARVFAYTNELGFNWIKQQIEWFLYEPQRDQYNWGEIDRIVNGARAAGLNVLLSVVKAPAWARPAGADMSVDGPPANPQDFADFMGKMAARYRGRVQAYEIWNEQNLHYEWGNEPLSAARYVEMLRLCYNAIKAADPNAIVVSGAPTPTGVNDGRIAIDDRIFLEQMYQAGLARYSDAIGAHPSGFNNPPDADWRTWSDPTAPDFKGHPSFFFRGTMEGYRNIMLRFGDGGTRIWPTEFGWSTFEGLGTTPPRGFEYANNNTAAEQSAWLVRAIQMSRDWGWVGPVFVWNLNFGPASGPADEKAGFGIVRHDWSRREAFYALRDMPKR